METLNNPNWAVYFVYAFSVNFNVHHFAIIQRFMRNNKEMLINASRIN